MCLCGPCLPALGAAQSCARRDSLGFSVSKIGRFLGLPTRGAASPPCSFGWGRMPGKTINRDLTKATRSMNTRSLMAKLSQPQLLTTVSVALLAAKPANSGLLKKPSEADRGAAEAAFLEGNVVFQQGDIAGAIRKYREAAERDPDHADAWTNLGNALSAALSHAEAESDRQNMYRQAIGSYLQALRANSGHVEANFNLGVLHHSVNNLQLAVAAYEKAVELDAQHVDALSNLGSARHKLQDLEGAIDAYQRVIEAVEDKHPRAAHMDAAQIAMLYYLVGSALTSLPPSRCQDAPCTEHAANKLRQALRHQPDHLEAQHALSALVADPAITTASEGYVRALFDEYASTFDTALLHGLQYRAPTLIRTALEELMNARGVASFSRVLDVGCGTGLMGPLLRNITDHLAGLDLSPEMVRQAEARGVYDELAVGELVQGLARYHSGADARALDLVVAADVFVYIGALESVLAGAAGALRKGALFAFTLESLEASATAEDESSDGAHSPRIKVRSTEDVAPVKGLRAKEYAVDLQDLRRGWKLQLTGRFAHTSEYVKRLAKANNFKVLREEAIVPRSDNGKDINGHLFVLQQTR